MSIRSFIFTAAAALVVASACGQQVNTVPALKVEGTRIYREGVAEPVVWRGLSFGWHNLWPRFFNEEAVASLVRGGVRWPVWVRRRACAMLL